MNLWVEDIANPRAEYADTEPTEDGPWSDKSGDITSWYHYGESAGLDYKAVRAKISIIAYTVTVGFTDMSQLTSDETRYCAEMFALPFAEIATELGSELEYYTEDWINRSEEARKIRWYKAKIKAFGCYAKQECIHELKKIETDSLCTAYFEGIEGTLEDNEEGLFDFVASRVGTSYELTGWKAQGYTPINGDTNEEAIDSIMNILQNGAL